MTSQYCSCLSRTNQITDIDPAPSDWNLLLLRASEFMSKAGNAENVVRAVPWFKSGSRFKITENPESEWTNSGGMIKFTIRR